jgi:hypothetical protein
MLDDLTWIAITCEPVVVGQVMVELFAEAASGSGVQEELETAVLFFGLLIKSVSDRSEANPIYRDARALMLRWLPATDPLGISSDPECGYSRPIGLVS